MSEGGGITVSRFLQAGLLDRLHVTVAPMLIGSGRPALTLPPIGTLAQALRPRCRHFQQCLGKGLSRPPNARGSAFVESSGVMNVYDSHGRVPGIVVHQDGFNIHEATCDLQPKVIVIVTIVIIGPVFANLVDLASSFDILPDQLVDFSVA